MSSSSHLGRLFPVASNRVVVAYCFIECRALSSSVKKELQIEEITLRNLLSINISYIEFEVGRSLEFGHLRIALSLFHFRDLNTMQPISGGNIVLAFYFRVYPEDQNKSYGHVLRSFSDCGSAIVKYTGFDWGSWAPGRCAFIIKVG
jgi:hypothetical protein